MNSSFSSGRKAEAVVANYLKQYGYTILHQNWRHPRAEIDIIISRGNIATCIEVKYRKSAAQGTGFDYITPKKLLQMKKAARLWKAATNWRGSMQLGACEVSGTNFTITSFILL